MPSCQDMTKILIVDFLVIRKDKVSAESVILISDLNKNQNDVSK